MFLREIGTTRTLRTIPRKIVKEAVPKSTQEGASIAFAISVPKNFSPFTTGTEDLFSALEKVCQTSQAESVDGVPQPKLANKANLLAAAVSLIQFIQVNGLDKYSDLKINISTKTDEDPSTLICSNQNGNIKYDIKLPNYSFTILMHNSGKLEIKLFNSGFHPFVYLYEDGTSHSHLCKEGELSDKANLKFLQGFIKTNRKVFLEAKAEEYNKRIEALSTANFSDASSCPDLYYCDEDFAQPFTVFGALLNDIFNQGYEASSTAERILSAKSIIAITDKLKQLDALSVGKKFDGYDIAYTEDCASETYFLSRNGKKIEIKINLDGNIEMMKLKKAGDLEERIFTFQ